MNCAEDYLAGLPNGLDSYPEAKCKASVFNRFAQSHRALLIDQFEDPALQSLVAIPPPSSTWLPEVHFQFMIESLRQHRFPKDEDFVDYAREINKEILSSRLYSILFRSMSHARVARLASSTWTRFRRGTSLTVVESATDSHVARMDFPRNLMTPPSVHGIITALEYALHLGGASGIRHKILESSPKHHTFEMTWADGA